MFRDSEQSMFSKHRLEALSDAVFAIVMTLLVLDLKVPSGVAAGQLGEALRHNSPEWASFVLTFYIAAAFWVLQHQLFDLIEGMGSETLVPTFFFLGLVAILPYSTSLLSHYPTEPLTFTVYFGNQAVIAIALIAKLEIARSRGYLHQGMDTKTLRIRLYFMGAVMASAILAAHLLPIKYAWMAPALLAVGGRVVKRFRKAASHKKAAVKAGS